MVYGISRRSRSETSKKGKIDARSAKPSVTTFWWVVCRDLWAAFQSRRSVVTPLVRLKQFIEAAEKNPKMSTRSNQKSESSTGGSGSRGANAVGKTVAGKEEQDGWMLVGKAGKSSALTSSRNTKNSSRSNLKGSMRAIGGARLSIWLISFHVSPRRKLVIISLQGWLLRNRPSLEVCWCRTGPVRP